MSYTKESPKKAYLEWGSGQSTGQAAVDGSPLPPANKSIADWNNSFTGAFHPNWRLAVRSGQNATTPASGIKRSFEGRGPTGHIFGYVSTEFPVNARRAWGTLPSGLPSSTVPVVGSEDSLNQDLARVKFAKSVERALTLFSGGVFLGELRETLHMIRNPGQSLFKGVKTFLSKVDKAQGKLRRIPKKGRLQRVQDMWLEASFGWLPALHDLDDARSYLQKRQDALYQELVPVKGFAQNMWLLSDLPEQFSAGVLTLKWRRRVRRNAIAILAGAVSSRASGQKLLNLSAMGLAPRSFVPTLWELIPWSFLIDYFTNVGDVITAWSNQYTSLAWGRETTIREAWTDLYDVSAEPNAVGFILKERSVNQATFNGRVRTFTRSPITTPPVPGFHFEIPGMGLKWLNMASLLQYRGSIRLH